MSDRRLRLRALIDAQFVGILLVILVAGVGGAALAYGPYVSPETVTEQQTETVWSVTTEHTHSATVTEPNPAFEVETTLSDRNTYPARVAPVLDVAVDVSYDATTAEDVTVTTDSLLVIENVEEDGETVFWQVDEPLGGTSEAAAPGEPIGTAFSINMSAVDEQISEIESELGSSPGETNVYVRTSVLLTGTVEGDSIEYSNTVDLPMSVSSTEYVVESDGTEVDPIEETSVVETQREYGPLHRIVGPVVAFVSLLAAGGLLVARRQQRFALSAAEREYLAYRADRDEFDEWITQIRLPTEVLQRTQVQAESLADLVDHAIDSDRGVIQHPVTNQYYVLSEDLIYTYAPPTDPRTPSPAAALGVPDDIDTDDGTDDTTARAGDTDAGAGGTDESVSDADDEKTA